MRFLTLDGLRGVSAMAVMIFHYGAAYRFSPFPRGYLAVDLFFLLSGFVIAYTYEDRLGSTWSIRRFAWARMVRLYPLAVAGVASVAFLHAIYPASSIGGWELLRRAVLNAALLPDLSARPEEHFPLVGPAWSLFYEIAVNAAYALALPWLTRRILWVVVAVAGVLLAVAAYRAGTVELLHHDLGTGAARTIFSFGLGVLAFRHMVAVIAALGNIPRLVSYALVLLAFSVPRLSGGNWAVDLFSIAVVSPLAFVIAMQPATRAAGTVESWLGDLSYPIYVLHMPVALYTGVGLGWAVSGAPLSAIACVATLVASYVALFYDRQARSSLNALPAVGRAMSAQLASQAR